jgi:hypothetical protein
MTTPYAVSVNKGSQSFDGYVNAPITGPLSTNQYPCTMQYHSYGTLAGIRPTPPQFLPGQEPNYSDMNTNARHQYLRTAVSNEVRAAQTAAAKKSPVNAFYNIHTGRYAPVSTHMNYITPMPSSMYVNQRKSNAVGKYAYKVGLPNEAPISSKCYYPSGTRSALQRARSSGCTAPKKKGSIYNYSLRNPAACSWGAFPRQNY